MRFFELAYCCRLYAQRSRFDEALRRLQQRTDGRVDLSQDGHGDLLLQWLRDWGIRTLRKADNDFSRGQLSSWYDNAEARLPPPERTLHELRDNELAEADEIYSSLAGLHGANR